MAATNTRARSYFTKLLKKTWDVTPRNEVVDPALEIQVDPISRDEASKPVKRDRSCKRSRSSSRRHRRAEGESSQPLPESIFAATTKFSKFVQTTVDESSYNMLQATDVVSLADTIIELSSRILLIGKMMKTKSTDSISLVNFEKIKNELAEAHEKIKYLTLQVKEIDALNTKRETEKENLENKITELNGERLKNDEEKAQLCKENQLLKEKMLELSTTKETDKSTIQRMEKEIDRIKVNMFEAESFLQQAKYFYKIPIDEGNIDVKKDFYNGELIPANQIPKEEAEDVNVVS